MYLKLRTQGSYTTGSGFFKLSTFHRSTAVSAAPLNEIEIGDLEDDLLTLACPSPPRGDRPLKSRANRTKYIYTKSKTSGEWDSCIHYEYNVVAAVSVRLDVYCACVRRRP